MSFAGSEWKPTRKQAEFLALPLSIKEAFYGGGAGSGKSDVLLVYPIVHRWHENPNFKQVFTRRTYQELKNEIVPRSREIYRRFGADFNKSDMIWTFPRLDQAGGTGLANGGAIIKLGHIENEDDIHQYDSMEINLFTPDELTSYLEFQYLYIGFTRVRTSDKSLPAIIRGAGMPGNIGHTWCKKRFVDAYPAGGKIIQGRGGNKRIYIHSTLADNPHIDPDYKQSLEALPEAEKNAKKYGDWNAYLGQVFEEFRDRHYTDEPENALHVIDPIEIPDWWPKIYAMDWGFAPPAMTWVGCGAISPERRLIIYRERAWQKTPIEEWCAFIKEDADRENPRIIRLCKSAGQDRGQEHTILSQISEALDRPVELSNNSAGSRVAGKILAHEYFRWKQKYTPVLEKRQYNEEHAQWLLRNRGLNEYHSYLNSFNEPEPERNLPKVQIFNTCPLLINAIKSCVYDKTNPQDVAEFPGDDAWDGFRYLLDSAERFFEESESEFAKIQATEMIIKQLQETNDQTLFYRSARKLESLGEVKPISRYHGRHA